MNQEEPKLTFKKHPLNSRMFAAELEYDNDGTIGHSKGDWYSHNRFIRQDEELDGTPIGINIAEMNTALEEYLQNSKLIALSRHAPHDCGDPECPGVINKRKLELYDKFQVAINEFAKSGLLT